VSLGKELAADGRGWSRIKKNTPLMTLITTDYTDRNNAAWMVVVETVESV
jgi:hypothetical protein